MPPLAFTHTPGLCLPWSGWIPQGEPQEVKFTVQGIETPAVRYAFVQNEERLVAFQLFSAGGVPRPFAFLNPNTSNRLSRLFSTWNAPREIIDEEILLYVPQSAGRESASAVAEQVLNAVVRRP